jgi:hypothetical protein
MSSCVSLGIEGLPEVRSEGLDAPSNEGSDGGRTASEDRGDRVLRKILVITQHDRRALTLRQPTEGFQDGLAIDRGVLRTRDRPGLGFASEEPPFDGSATEVVLREVHDDPAQVGVERAGVPQVTEVPDHSDERVLRDVLRDRLVTGQEVGEPDGPGRRALV